MGPFRFNEDDNLENCFQYIQSTYGQHYAGEVGGKNVQLIDIWDAQGSLLTTARDTAQKYLARFGKKDGLNPKDAYKAIHYTLLMLYAAQSQNSVKEEGPVYDSEVDQDNTPDADPTNSISEEQSYVESLSLADQLKWFFDTPLNLRPAT